MLSTFNPARSAWLFSRAVTLLGDSPGHPFRGNQWVSGGGAKAANIDERIRGAIDHIVLQAKKSEAIESVHIVGSWAAQHPDRMPDREGKSSDIDVMIVPKSGNSIREDAIYRKRAWLLAAKLEKAGKKLGREIHVNVEPVIGTSPHLSLKIAGDVPGHPFHGNQWTAGHGVDTWNKNDASEGQVLNGVEMKTEENPDFKKSINADVYEPEFPQLPKGKHAAAGLIVTEPDGRVWVVQPEGRYGGYRATFPKGTVDEGETLQEAAARETWEETGLVARVTGHLVDVERTTSVTRFYMAERIGGAPWAHGKETHAVQLLPIKGKGIENALRRVGGSKTTDHSVLHNLRQRLHLIDAEFNPDQPRDDHGRWSDTSAEGWPEGLTNVSGAKGSNPGGLYKDAHGNKWYVKRYNNPQQAQTEHISNEIYRAVGVNAPQSVLGDGGDYASKWQPSDGTLAKVGITKDRADRILDGFAADVFLNNWDAVGTGHDNILVSGNKVTRIDQGGTLLFRAQGALKPEEGLEKIGEWNSLVEKNYYYGQIFKAAGYKNGDALGERAAKQIDKIVAARPKGGWKEFVDRVAPKAKDSFREKVAKVLESRQGLLEKKRDSLRGKKEIRTLYNPDQPRVPAGDPHGGQFSSTGTGSGGETVKKKKAPKAAPVPLESKKAAYDEVKAGGTFKNTAAKYGMTQGQLAGYVWKVDQAKKKAEESLEEDLAAKTVVKAKDVVPDKPAAAPKPSVPWTQMNPEQKMLFVHESGYKWLPKPNSTHGNHAWFDADGNQVSAFGPKESYREKLDTINYGQGPQPKVPDVAPEPGQWPLAHDAERDFSHTAADKVSKYNKTWSQNLTGGEIEAINSYTGSGYSGLNSALREGKGLTGYQSTMNKNLNSAIDKAPTPPPPELVWRGISSGSASHLFAGLKHGDQLTMKGFQSTSISPKFAHSWGSGHILFEIKPSKGAYVKLHSTHPSEQEYLLPHNAKYTVRGVSHVKMAGYSQKIRVLQLEMH